MTTGGISSSQPLRPKPPTPELEKTGEARPAEAARKPAAPQAPEAKKADSFEAAAQAASQSRTGKAADGGVFGTRRAVPGQGVTSSGKPETAPAKGPEPAGGEPVGRLGETDRKTVQDTLAGTNGPAAKADLDRMMNRPEFKGLPTETQTKVLETFAKHPASTISNGHLDTLVQSPNFRNLGAAEQAKALEVFQKTDTEGRGRLVDLTNRTVYGGFPPTARSALQDVDSKGGKLLDSLHSIATNPLDPGFAANGVSRESLLSTVMQEAGKPGQVTQASAGTCTVTNMQFMLCDQNPAEYVRLMSGLLGPAGTAQLANGDTMRRVSDSLANDSASWDRSASERVFQAALMDYANGGAPYSNVTNIGEGLGTRGEQEKAMEALFNRKFDVYDGSWNFQDDKQDIVDKLEDRAPLNTYVRVAWGDKKSGGHALAVDKVENGRVYFRNPWGPSGDPNGTAKDNPPRRIEDNTRGYESMSVEDFKRWVTFAMIPE